jgi:hypothetical protein
VVVVYVLRVGNAVHKGIAKDIIFQELIVLLDMKLIMIVLLDVIQDNALVVVV